MKRVIAALTLLALPVAPALAQTGTTTPQTLPPSSSPTTVTPQSPSGTPSPFLTPQPFGTTSSIDPTTGLPTNLPSSSLGTGLGTPSTSPSGSPTLSGPSPTAHLVRAESSRRPAAVARLALSTPAR